MQSLPKKTPREVSKQIPHTATQQPIVSNLHSVVTDNQRHIISSTNFQRNHSCVRTNNVETFTDLRATRPFNTGHLTASSDKVDISVSDPKTLDIALPGIKTSYTHNVPFN